MISLTFLKYERNVSKHDLGAFFTDLGGFLETGMPPAEALESLGPSTADEGVKRLIEQMRKGIKQGETFSSVLTKTRLPGWIQVTLGAWEQAGRLDEGCVSLGLALNEQAQLETRLKHALIYPSIMLVLMVGVMVFILVKVVPTLRVYLPIEDSFNAASYFLLGVSEWLSKTWMKAFSCVLILGVGLWHGCKHARIDLTKAIYSIPIIGSLRKNMDIALTFAQVGVMLESSMPLLDVLGVLKREEGTITAQKLASTARFVYGGLSWWEAMKQDEFFDRAIVFSVQRGEELARLDEYCQKISILMSKRSLHQMETMLTLIQPLLFIGAGSFLMFIATALFLPIYSSLTKIAG